MNSSNTGRQVWLATLISIMSLAPQAASATIVQFQTVMGDFEVNLYDNSTPATVANFLEYVNNGDYTTSVIHRSVPGFVIQGGGFTNTVAFPLQSIRPRPAVVNEPVFSNVRGSIAMAKVGGDPNSATSQWFFNLSNNAANLDGQNGGFTVFGEVVGNGMDVVDAIAALPVFNFGGAATGELPVRNYTATDFANGVPFDETHLVIINAIIVSDSTVNSAAGLNPPLTTNQPNSGGNGGGGGGGAFGFLSLLGLLLIGGLGTRRQRIRLY